MTWKEFQIMVMAMERKEVNEWRRFRFLGWLQYATNTTDKAKKTIEQFMPLPGDPKRERGRPVTPEEVKQRLKLMGSGSRNVKDRNNSG